MAYEEEEHMDIMWKRNSPDENWVAFTTKDYHKRMKELLAQQRELLIDFQNFLILDGQLSIEPDEVKRNAEIFLGD